MATLHLDQQPSTSAASVTPQPDNRQPPSTTAEQDGPHPSTPPKDQCFQLRLPASASTDELVNGVYDVAGNGQIYGVQHRGGNLFQVGLNSKAAMDRVMRQGGIYIADTLVPVELLGARIVTVSCLMVPLYLQDEVLLRALSKHGKILEMKYVRFADKKQRGYITTGTRLVKMEISETSPPPNFIRIRENLICCEYPGVRRVCRRCKQEGHIRSACDVPFCERCTTFGHTALECGSRCRRCRGEHRTTECTRPTTYAAAATGTDFPRLPPPAEPSNIGTSAESAASVTQGAHVSPPAASVTETSAKTSEESTENNDPAAPYAAVAAHDVSATSPSTTERNAVSAPVPPHQPPPCSPRATSPDEETLSGYHSAPSGPTESCIMDSDHERRDSAAVRGPSQPPPKEQRQKPRRGPTRTSSSSEADQRPP